MRYLVGVDIGGTFTDCVAIDTQGPSGSPTPKIGKALSTPPDFQSGFVAALRAAASMHGISLEQLLQQAHVYHGCTVGTNALVENKTARVGLIATRGHADAIFIMRAGARLKWMPSNYIANVAKQTKPAPLVSKDLCEEVDERVTFDGRILVQLNEETARTHVEEDVSAQEARAKARAWLHSPNGFEGRSARARSTVSVGHSRCGSGSMRSLMISIGFRVPSDSSARRAIIASIDSKVFRSARCFRSAHWRSVPTRPTCSWRGSTSPC